MLAVVQIGSSTLRSECMTARIVLVWAWARAAGATTNAAASEAAARIRSFIGSALPACGRAGARGDLGLVGRLHLGHVLVALRGEPQRIVAELDRRILRQSVGRLAGRQALDHGVMVGIAEERH